MIYFVCPIYNEENNIRKVIPEIRKLMKDDSYRIVAVNDGSSDGSQKVLDELMDRDIIVEGSKINMNIGAAFSLAIDRVLYESHGNNDMMIIMESDQTSEINVVRDLIDEIQKGNDVSIASRYKDGGGYKNFPFRRLMTSYGANGFLRWLFPISPDVIDYTIFMRAYRVSVLRKVSKYFGASGLIQSQGFIANSELLLKIALFTKRISEVPLVYDYGKKIGSSKMNILRTINEYFVFAFYMKGLVKQMKKKNDLDHLGDIISVG